LRSTEAGLSYSFFSDVPDEIARAYAERCRDTQQGMEADPLLTPLDFAHVNGMQVGFFRQFFLAQTGPATIVPDGVSEGFELLPRARHSRSKKQEGGMANTPNMGLFFYLTPPAKCGQTLHVVLKSARLNRAGASLAREAKPDCRSPTAVSFKKPETKH
jgi:hypothetical protein